MDTRTPAPRPTVSIPVGDDTPTVAGLPAVAPGPPPAAIPAAAGPRTAPGWAGRSPVPGAPDPAQDFVSRLRSAAPGFATAAGAESAVVREAVPPARHRRSRCRVVLRFADGDESDVTFLGPVSRAATEELTGFHAHIEQWFGAGQGRDQRWLVDDDEAADGVAVDVTAWRLEA